jgi:hypothetical protein
MVLPLSRTAVLRAFVADAGLLEPQRRFQLESRHPGCRAPVLEPWVRFVDDCGARLCHGILAR